MSDHRTPPQRDHDRIGVAPSDLPGLAGWWDNEHGNMEHHCYRCAVCGGLSTYAVHDNCVKASRSTP